MPFFLHGRPAVATGVGEVFRYLEGRLFAPPLLIVNPHFPVSAKWAYTHLAPERIGPDDSGKLERLIDALRRNDPAEVAANLHNDLAYALYEKFPLLAILRDFLREKAELFHSKGIRVSVFVNPDPAMVRGAVDCGADRVELYTEAYASAYGASPEAAIRDYVAAAEEARRVGLGLNAGHDLNLDNLRYFISRIPFTDEVSIGHALISDALYYGLEKTVAMYLDRVKG